MVGKIEIPISVQGVTKSLTELQYLFDIKTKILNVKPTELNTVIDNEFKRWMLENYEIPLVSDDFTLTSEILTAVDDRTKIVNITIKANDKIQTKISDQFTTSFEILVPSYDISNLKVNIIKEVDYRYDQKVTKLQLSQLILPLIKNEIINIVKNQTNIVIEQYQDFWLDINVPEINNFENQKPITVVINTTNNKVTGHLLLNINIKKKDEPKVMIVINNQ